MANEYNPNYGTQTAPPVVQPVNPATATPPAPSTNPYDVIAAQQPSTVDYMKQVDTQLGIPEQQKIAGTLREQIGSFEDALKRVAPNIDARSRNSIVTQAQREGMIGAEQKPIYENLVQTQTNLGRVTEGITALQERAARLIAGFTADKQTALELALAKLKRGEQLTDEETQRAWEAAQAEKEFNRQKELIRFNTNENIRQSRALRTGNGSDKNAEDYLGNNNGNNNGGTPTPNTTPTPTTPPNFSMPVGTVTEFPKGSGIYWTSKGTQGWE